MPANSPIWKGFAPGTLVETPGSGSLDLAERVTYKQQLAGRKADADAFALVHPRGSQWWLMINGGWGKFYVEKATSEQEKGGKGIVTVTYTYLGVVPPDEFALTVIEVNPALQKHPIFASLSNDDLAQARIAFNAATAEGRSSIDNVIGTVTNAELVTSLINKWLRGEETYYLAGLKFQHTLHFTTPPLGSLGGFIEYPFGVFSGYVSNAGMSWLRAGDEVCWSNGLWKLTRTWNGGPNGAWDPDLY